MEEELSKRVGFFYVGLKELVGNLVPAYISLLVILFLIDKIRDATYLLSLFFLAGLIAVGMSALQPYILRLIIRPNKYIQNYIFDSYKKFFEQEQNEENTDEFDNIIGNSENLYESFISQSIEKFWEKRERLSGEEKKFYEIKEGRLFLYFYLGLMFAFITLISLYENIFNTTFLIKISQISKEFPYVTNYYTLLFLLITIVFFLGSRHEITRYRNMITNEIPVIAATKDSNNLEHISLKLEFLKKKKKDYDIQVYNDKKEEYEKELVRIQKLQVEKDYLQERVEELTKKQIDLDSLFKPINEDTSYSTETRTIFPTSLISIIVGIISVVIFIYTILSSNEFFTNLLPEVPLFIIVLVVSSIILSLKSLINIFS